MIAAAVIPTEEGAITKQEVVDFLYGKVASAKVPRYVSVGYDIPVSGRGKVQKYILRDELSDMVEDGELEKIKPSDI